MSTKMKKVIPALVGSTIALNQVPTMALENSLNMSNDKDVDTSNKKEVEKESIGSIIISGGESSDVIIGDITDEEIINDIKKEEAVKEEVSETDKQEVKQEASKEEVVKEEVEEKLEEKEVQTANDVEETISNKLARTTTNSNQKVMKVKVNNAIVRESSDTSSKEVGTLSVGTYVDVYEQSTTGGWTKINYEGKMAYITTSNLEDIDAKYKEISEDNVSIKKGAGESYDNFGTLSKGSRVKVYQELSNGWSKIDYSGKIAFVQTSKLVETYQTKATVAIEKANVYKDASSTSSVLGTAKKGDIVYVYEETGVYYKIKYSTGFGYIKKADTNVVTEGTQKPQTGDSTIALMGIMGLSATGLVSINRKKKK